MKKAVKNSYEFGKFRLYPTERLFLCEGQPVHLQSRAFDTLLILVQNSGHLVQKEELLKTVWEDSFVEENNLTQNIYALRKALNGENYIETVARHGYRFNGDVRELVEETESSYAETHSVLRVRLEEQVEERQDSFFAHFGVKTLATVLGVVLIAGGFLVWRTATRSESGMVALPAGVKTLAVLPFEVEDPTAADEFLDSVIADDVSRQLARSDSLKLRFVTPGSKALENGLDAQTLGKLLKADIVLTGTVRKNGNAYQTEAKLINTGDGAVIWKENFESVEGDLYKINDAMVKKFVNSSVNTDVGDLRKHRPATLEAYKTYMKARSLWNKRTGAELHQARVLMEKALSEDPNFALAYAGLADCYAFDLSQRHKAVETANKALKFDPRLGEAHATLGFIYLFWDWNIVESERQFKQAVALSPHYATGHQWYAAMLASSRMIMAAKEEINTALELEPASLPINADTGQILYFAQEYEKAIDQCNRTLALDPTFINAYGYLYQIYLMKGMYSEAVDVYFKREEIAKVDSKWAVDHNARLKKAFAEGGITEFWYEMIDYHTKYPSNAESAFYHARLGNTKDALRLLETSSEKREFDFIFAFVNPVFDSYFQDPRFRKATAPFDLIVQKANQ